MASVFTATADIVQDMCNDFKTLTGVTLNPSQLDDPRVLKMWTDAGAISAFYAQLQRQANDFFPQTASTAGLILHLAARSLEPQIQQQPATGQIQFTFSAAATILTGAQVQRLSDGAVFNTIQSGSGSSSSSLTLWVQAVVAGAAGNLDALSEPFVILTPPTGVNAACTNVSLFLDGRDIESNPEMLARIQVYDQDQNSGGNATAYEAWAQAASADVVTAKCIPLLRGPDTVDLVITSGTTDIAAAIAAGESVTRIPSDALIATVLAYVDALNPVTDQLLVRAPTAITFNVTFNYSLYTETTANRSYVNSQITQILQVLIYSANPLDIITPTQIERLVDQTLGSLINERLCSPFGTSGITYYQVPQANILIPGTLTLGALT